MTDIFGNYNIQSNDSLVKLNYLPTSKDISDFLLLTLFGIGSLCISCFLLVHTLITNFSWINLIVILIFGLTGVVKVIELISRLSEPTNGIICIDKKSNSILIKKPHFKKEKILMSELDRIEYHLHTDYVRNSGNTVSSIKRRYWIEVQLFIKNERKIKLLNINPSQILDIGNEGTKRELFKIAKPLISKISNELEISNIYKGVIDED
ncbi:MAG: hypothetical protein ACI8ZQ_001628 [Bacteroidia bacterium]|jgi:hypothetical protein